MSGPFSKVEDSDWGKHVDRTLQRVERQQDEWDGKDRRDHNGKFAKITAAILFVGSIGSALVWLFNHDRELNSTIQVNAARIELESAQRIELERRVLWLESENRRIGMTQAERTQSFTNIDRRLSNLEEQVRRLK